MPQGIREPAEAANPRGHPARSGSPARLHRVTLTLARCPQHPDGSAGRGYEILAPLGPDGRLDAALWHEARDRCRVRRFWTGEPDRHGRLVHRAGGEGGATWLIDYEDWTNEDDEAGYRLGTHAFVEGEYVSIREAGDDAYHTFRVARIERTIIGERS
ncbi:hypothetical protein PMNALOAF_0765 [Methylobacterium adhaesivum]|jgi:hypothetical protein|uniref:Uncharacterized protein n=1 Tax=Methylobacterium adhaesivum TaxID=333297 RepID=A0ABT8BG19_9HYPH|nr:hypothetical protein [Methylobacterium adhaesivum]MDN3591078.1 hypothetical protein [Methylobacterium adhaesivum]GJD29532.1 hypothetical protein PMNALOAF_0765 [Methylobacterium adhaesivum]